MMLNGGGVTFGLSGCLHLALSVGWGQILDRLPSSSSPVRVLGLAHSLAVSSSGIQESN